MPGQEVRWYQSHHFIASKGIPWPGATTKRFKTMKYGEGAPFDMERRPQRHTRTRPRGATDTEPTSRSAALLMPSWEGGSSTKGSKRREIGGIQEFAGGRGGCHFDTERHPPRPQVGGADEHSNPLPSCGRGGRPGPSMELGPGQGG